MQEEFRDMDLLMRRMLEDAEAKPSRRVWKAVSARIAATPAPAVSWRPYAWAGLAFASLAFLFGIFRTPSQEIGIVPAGGHHAYALLTDTPEVNIPAASGPDRDLRSFRRKAVTLPAEEADVIIVAEEAATEAAAPAESVSGQRTPSRQRSSAAHDTWQEWSSMEQEDAEPRGFRHAIYAKGMVSGNESAMNSRSGVTFLAPGDAMSGFSEVGESVYGVPFTIGLGARFYVSRHLSVGSGIDYSLLTRTFSGKYTSAQTTQAGSVLHTMQYVGIPVNIYYDVLTADKIRFYAYAGGEMEFCVSNRYRLFANQDITSSYPVRKPQFSAAVGVGVEFLLTNRIGLYLDPGARYYFPGGQPKSVRTDKPLLVNFDAGLRFNF